MNQIKRYFQVLNHICLEPLGRDVLNFKSKKAYDYELMTLIKLGSHFLHGTTLELINVYANDVKVSNENITTLGFLTWQTNVKSPYLTINVSIGPVLWIRYLHPACSR